jgi:hypothetical protein
MGETSTSCDQTQILKKCVDADAFLEPLGRRDLMFRFWFRSTDFEGFRV